MEVDLPSETRTSKRYYRYLVLLILLIALALLGATKSSPQNWYSESAAVLPTALAAIFSLRNTFRNRGTTRLFWCYFFLGFGLWAVHIYSNVVLPSMRFVHEPGSDLADLSLFLHFIFFTAALLIPIVAKFSEFDRYQHLLDFAFLLSFWIVIYAYFVSPFDFIIPNAEAYDWRFRTLQSAMGLNLAILAGLLAYRAKGSWGTRYKQIFTASAIYVLSLASSSVPGLIPRSGMVLPFVFEQFSSLGFLWIAMAGSTKGPTGVVAEEDKTATTVRFNPAVGALITVFLVVLGIADSLRVSESHTLVSYRLTVIVASTIVFVPLLLREILKQRLQRARENEHLFQQVLSDSALYQSNKRYEELVETVPAIVWQVELESMSMRFVNRQLKSILGYSPESWLRNPQVWADCLPEEDFRRLKTALTGAQHDQPLEVDHHFIAADGTLVWLKSTVRPVLQSPLGPHLIGVSTDITEQKEAERSLRHSESALRSSEKRRRLFVEQTLLGVIEWDSDFRVREWNSGAAAIFGFTADEAIGKLAFETVVPRELHSSIANLFENLLKDQSGHRSINENIRKDGKHITCEWFNTLIKSEAEVLGVISFVHDVTSQKQAEQSLREFGARLLDAQEEERHRIARELHDNIGQELSILSMNIGTTSISKERLLEKASEIVRKVSRLSHQLHSAQLDLLGLDSALRTVCGDLREGNHLKVVYASRNIPAKLDPHFALCFYRVLQEALHNVQKHSGAKHVSVEALGENNELLLTITDDGCGFDTNSIKATHGLGLVSMRERLLTVGGRLTITTAAGKGTEIVACAPLQKAKPAQDQKEGFGKQFSTQE